MRKVLLLLLFLGSTLFADQWVDKHHKYGTTPVDYEPVSVVINPDYVNTYRNSVTISVSSGSYDSEISWSIYIADGGVVASGGAPLVGDDAIVVTMPDGLYSLIASDEYSDGWNGASMSITDNTTGNVYFTYAMPAGNASETVQFEISQSIPGCITATACNYDSEATDDDGSCCITNCNDLIMDGGSYASEVSVDITDASGTVLYAGGAVNSFLCLDDGTYTLNGYDSYGDGWNGGANAAIYDGSGQLVAFLEFPTGSSASVEFTLPYVPVVEAPEGIFFSEYTEGASNNKYLEIYNGTDESVDLTGFAFPSTSNAPSTPGEYEYWNTFPDGATVAAGDVYVIAHPSADAAILAEADHTHQYLSNGDDGYCLVVGTEDLYALVDCIGDFQADPGSGWAVAGVENATKDHTLVRKVGMVSGNMGDWATSAGTDAETSEWSVIDLVFSPVLDENGDPVLDDDGDVVTEQTGDWTGLGSHSNVEACAFSEVTLYLVDSYGDSWNGNILTIGDQSFTIDGVNDDGAAATFTVCLEDGLYSVTCGGGTYQTEVSWEMRDDEGLLLLSGGAPYDGSLQIGEPTDILGCTDPTALNYDETATFDDGSCTYAGDVCATAVAAVAGSNTALGAPTWFSYTASLTGTATISSVGGGVDTQVYGYSGTCDALVEIGFGDDEGGSPEWSSIMVLDVVAGESYYINWTDGWSTDGFDWTLEEALYPVNPQNLTAEAGMESVYLAWEGAAPPARSFIEIENELQERARYQAEKKETLVQQEQGVHLNSYRVNPDYAANSNNSRTNSVVINLGGGTWQEEISWNITDAAGTVVAEGGAPIENLELVLEDGTYIFNGFDSYGDGWNGNFVTATNATQVFLFWFLDTGNEGSAEFEVNDGAANLSLSNLNYDNSSDILSLDVTNNGTLWAYGGDIGFFLGTSASGDCQDANSVFQSVPQALAPGESYSFPLTGIQPFLGYGVHAVGAMIDWSCDVPETNENDNIINAEITIEDPLAGITYSVYRDASGSGTFDLLVSGLESAMYLDETATGGTEHCYHVTQTEGGVESGASNSACATPYSSSSFPAPTALMGEAEGYDVMLEWTAPDLTDWEPPMNNSRFAPFTGEKNPNYTPSNTGESTPPATRQGGDTFETATMIDALPYTDNGSTAGLTADYGPYDDLSGLVCDITGYYSAVATGSGADAVYSIDLAEAGNVNISLCGSGYDTGLGVFTSDGVLVAANDDFCTLQSEITCQMPAGMYYIVVSGYGANEGDYTLNVNLLEDPSPVAGYAVYRDGEMVGTTEGVDVTSFTEFVYNPETPEGGTYTYTVSAYYNVQDVLSVNSNSVDVTTTAPPFECVAPSGLMAESQGNDVMLDWNAPEGGPSWFTHFDGTVNSGVGTATGLFTLEAAVKFGPETTLDLSGLSLTKVGFYTSDVTALFKVMIYDPVSMLAVDSTDVIDPTTLVVGDWNVVELPNPVALNGSDVMFGYKVTATTEGTYPASTDLVSDANGMDNLIAGFGAGFQSMLDAYDIDGGWAIAGYADYAQGRSIVSLDPPVFDNIVVPGDLDVRHLANSVELSLPVEEMNRALLSFHIYRNDTTIATVPVSETSYDDMDAPWGMLDYHVTALYDDTEECGESAPSNVVTLDLANTPPAAVNLIAPADGHVINLTEANMEDQTMFVWSPSSDADNDPLQYFLGFEAVVEGDTLDHWVPENALMNGDFDEGSDHWEFYPPEMVNISMDTTEEMLTIGGLNNGGTNTENNVYQSWPGDALPAGTEFEVYAGAMSPEDNFIGEGNHVVLFAKYFNASWGLIEMHTSEPMNSQTASAGEYHELELASEVVDGAAVMQVGLMYVQSSDAVGGVVHVDEMWMHIPMTVTGMGLPNSLFAEPMLELEVNELTFSWDVWAADGFDETESNGLRTFTVNANELLSLNGVSLPTAFALHNNYPNPFNPVTNILYDVPELTDVTLEIFNVMGQRVRTLAQGSHEPGRYQIVWNATNDIGESLSSGMYIYRIQAGDFVSVKKLVLMK